MALKIYDTIVPQGDYPAVKAEHVQMPNGTRLSDLEVPEEVTDYVKSVNGAAPDKNGNVEIEIPEQETGLPEATTDGMILQVVSGVWTAVAMKDSAVKTYIDDYINSALEGDY